jgi:MinD superfamily P-loop ATPase
MKEIVILSGKGGVGKSVLTAALGWQLAGKARVALADTDVDAPNLHLTLGAQLQSGHEIKASEKALIDYGKCSACLQCQETCKFSAIIGNEKPLVLPYSCEGCGACAIACPEQAITIASVTNGRINLFSAETLIMVGGELQIGESNSGMLVDAVKEEARLKAEEIGAEILLIDGPPGIGCPVIAAVQGADFAVTVTEPTPAALHDLARVIQVIHHFQVPVGIVINRADLYAAGKKAICRYAEITTFRSWLKFLVMK